MIDLLQDVENQLLAGWTPSESHWSQIRNLPDPWGRLTHESLQEIRSHGGALLPTLKRLRALAEDQSAILDQVSAKMAQAYLQAMVCFLSLSFFGVFLYRTIPEIAERKKLWILASGLATGLSSLGIAWMVRLGSESCWAGLSRPYRSWVLSAHCAGERFLALVRVGSPPDIAWAKACEFLRHQDPELARLWGHSLWLREQESGFDPRSAGAILVGVGHSIKKSVQISLMEGHPCAERVETLLQTAKRDFKALLDFRLAELGTHSLKPLFLCVAPAFLGLLAFGLWLAFSKMAGEGLDALG